VGNVQNQGAFLSLEGISLKQEVDQTLLEGCGEGKGRFRGFSKIFQIFEEFGTTREDIQRGLGKLWRWKLQL
jgi:hypothetical protein